MNRILNGLFFSYRKTSWQNVNEIAIAHYRGNAFYITAFSLLIVSFSYRSSGQIYSYTNSTSGSPSYVDPNATGTSLSRVNGASVPGSPCSTGFTAVNFSSATTFSTSLPAIEFTVSPNSSSLALNITGFTADLRRSNTGP